MVGLFGCERELSTNTNYQYMFQALYDTDDWGIENWGGHLFILDDPIQDMDAFKECYVNYLDWAKGNDVPKKAFYNDRKDVKVTFVRETTFNYTSKDINNCN